MDASSEEWIAELGIMEIQVPLEYDVSLSSESFSSCTTDELFGENGIIGAPQLGFERPTKVLKTSSSIKKEQITAPFNYKNSSPKASTPSFLSFTNSNALPPQTIEAQCLTMKPKVKIEYESMNNCSHVPSDQSVKESQGPPIANKHKRTRSAASTPHSLSQEHIIAERRRREKLSERLIALSALIPGLKKMDKASVLGEAVNYLKYLQERIITLEERVKQRNVESLVLVKKSHVYMDDEEDAKSSSSNEESSSLPSGENALPEIQASFMDKEVLITIHCEKQQGLLPKILNEMENLHLSVTNSNSMPFGDYDLVIIIKAQMKATYSITAKDFLNKLRTVF